MKLMKLADASFHQFHMKYDPLYLYYRMLRDGRIAENAFGILSQRWQILLTKMQHEPKTIAIIVQACDILHNLMRIRYPVLQNNDMNDENANNQFIPSTWWAMANMHDVDSIQGNNPDSTAAKRQQEYLKLYFTSEAGLVPWQEQMIRKLQLHDS